MKRNLILLTGVALVVLITMSIIAFSWPWQTTGNAVDARTAKVLKISEGEPRTFKMGGVNYTISIEYMTKETVRLKVNDEISPTMAKGYVLDVGGLEVKVNNIKYQNKVGAINYATIQFKKSKINTIPSSEGSGGGVGSKEPTQNTTNITSAAKVIVLNAQNYNNLKNDLDRGKDFDATLNKYEDNSNCVDKSCNNREILSGWYAEAIPISSRKDSVGNIRYFLSTNKYCYQGKLVSAILECENGDKVISFGPTYGCDMNYWCHGRYENYYATPIIIQQ